MGSVDVHGECVSSSSMRSVLAHAECGGSIRGECGGSVGSVVAQWECGSSWWLHAEFDGSMGSVAAPWGVHEECGGFMGNVAAP